MKAQKMESFTVELQPKPGALARVYAALAEAKINVLASWGYEMGPGEAQVHLTAKEGTRLKEVLTKLGFRPEVGAVCLVEGADKPGEYAAVLKKIADAKINVHATDALSVGGKFVASFFVDDKDLPTLCKVLGC